MKGSFSGSRFFIKLWVHEDILYSQVQKRDIEPTYAENQVTIFERQLKDIREGVNENSTDFYEYHKRRTENGRATCNLMLDAKEVCDVISFEAKKRFKFSEYFAASLFLPEKFSPHSSSFMETCFITTIECYTFFEPKKL